MVNLNEWEEFWASEPVVFSDGHSQPVGDVRPGFGKPERGISPSWYDDFEFFGGSAGVPAPIGQIQRVYEDEHGLVADVNWFDPTFTRRTGRSNQ